MTEKQFQAILSPISRLEAVSEQNSEKLSSIEMLTIDIKSLQSDTVAELKQQTTLLSDIKSMIKESSKGGAGESKEIESSTFKPMSVKDTGLAAFMMVSLSAAIVASAGLFTLIPKVSLGQLGTAVAISATFALVAPKFVEIMKTLSGVETKDGENTEFNPFDAQTMFNLVGGSLLLMVGLAAAITAASWVMQLIMPVSPLQLLTAVLIGAGLAAASFAYVKILEALEDRDINDIKNAGIAMVVIAGAIAVASLILQLVIPVSLDKVGTILLVGIALIGGAYAMAQILKEIEGKTLKDIGLAALAMLAIAPAMVAASHILQYINPITDPYIYLTVFLIGLSMVSAAYSFKLLIDAVSGKSTKDLVAAGAAMIVIAGAIWATAWIFTQLPPVNDMVAPPWKWTLKTGLALVIFGLAFAGLIKAVKGQSVPDLLKAAAAMVVISIAILAVAWIFQVLPDSFKTVPAEWTLKTGLAILIFSVSIAVVGLLTKSLGVPTMAMGALGSVIVALGILGVAWIFSALPSAELTAPPISWTLSVALALVLFSIPIAIIGAIAMSGAGAVAILAGVVGMIVIASGIWAVAWIFSKMPDISGVAKMLTTALLAPVNGIVDVLKRLKDEVGVENLLPLAGGIVAIAGSLLVLAAASAGAAAAGLGASLMNAGKAFVDFISGSETRGPLDTLSEIVNMAPQIAKVAGPIKILGEAFMFLQGGQNMEVLVRFFEIMQKDPKMSNVKAIQDISNPMVKMISALSNIPVDAPQRLQDLFSKVSWSSIMTPVASVASSMAILALNASLAGNGVTLVASGMERMVKALNSLTKDSIESIIKLFNDVNWPILVDPIDAISISIKRMSDGAIETGEGMKMAANALQLMSSIPAEILAEIAKVFNALAKDPLTTQGEAMGLISRSIVTISASMLTMRSDAFVRMFEVMSSSSSAIATMSKPMKTIAGALDQMGRINVDGIEWAHKMARQLARSSFNSQATALEKMAKSYGDISKSSNSMNVEAINATSDMFKALAYLYQNGKRNAIEELGDKLIDAVQELASMIADFDNTVGEQNQGSKSVGEALAKAADNLVNVVGLGGNSSSGASSPASGQDLAFAMQEMVDLLQTGQAKITITDIDQLAADKI